MPPLATPSEDSATRAPLDGAPESAAPPTDSERIRRWWRFGLRAAGLGLLASVAVVIFTFEEATWEHLGRLDLATALGAAALVGTAWCASGGRLWVLTRGLGHRLSWRRCFGIVMASEFGIAATPAGAGGAALWLGFLRASGVPLSRGTALLTAELVVDVLVFVLLLPFALASLVRHPALLERLEGGIAGAWLVPLAGLGLLAAGLTWLLRRDPDSSVRRWLRELGEGRRWFRHLRVAWYRRHRFFRRVRMGLHTLFRVRPGFVFLTVVLAVFQWGCRYSVLPLLILHLTGEVDLWPLVLLQGLLLALAYLVVAPGGGGGVELAAVLLLQVFAPPAVVGVVVVLWRFFTYHLYLLTGGTALAILLTAER